MDFTNLTHCIILHYIIALVAGGAVMLGLVPDISVSLLLAVIGWLAFCMAGYLTLCHDHRTFGQSRNPRRRSY